MSAFQSEKKRMSPNAGIAIGPILFIIAILAILASAIAAGSGSFTGGTGAESNKTKSSALVQIGENLKMGMDQITMRQGISASEVDIDITHTTASNMLFSPLGGGIAPPSVGMANNPVYDIWYFPEGPITGFGTGGDDVVAVLAVSQGVCAEINNRSMGIAAIPPATALGDFTAGTVSGTWPPSGNDWTVGTTATTTTGPTLQGVATGCVYNSSITLGAGCATTGCTAGPTSQYFYYQVLGIE